MGPPLEAHTVLTVYCTVCGLPLSAPKVPFLNSALSEECPGSLYWRYRIDGSALSGLDEACPGAKPTPKPIPGKAGYANPSLASLARWV